MIAPDSDNAMQRRKSALVWKDIVGAINNSRNSLIFNAELTIPLPIAKQSSRNISWHYLNFVNAFV